MLLPGHLTIIKPAASAAGTGEMMTRLTLPIALLATLFTACEETGTVTLDAQPDARAHLAGDAAELTATPDTRTGPDAIPAPEMTDASVTPPKEVSEDVRGLACDPGEGCFGDVCENNSDCDSGWCVEHMGQGLCSKLCQEECPAGWSCTQVTSGGPDLVYVCVSAHPNLCRPCAQSANCAGSTGTEDACVNYGDQGSFCGGACGQDESCPWGFTCLEVETVDGAVLSQCVNDAGVCPCTDTSIALGLWTPCQVVNDFGLCQGKRYCQEDGLSECTATTPAPEKCNGLDDDCDDEIDEPNLLEGQYIGLCEDQNECTDDKCMGIEGCTNSVLDSGSCDDDNPCTVADHCVAGTCVGGPVDCDDGNPCTDNFCTESGGCEHPPAFGNCDDGDPCTLGDHCFDGVCQGEAVGCECQTDQDCAALEDGDLCNGTLFCDTSAVPYECTIDKDSVVLCPEPDGKDALCLAGDCDPATGDCSMVPDHEGWLCGGAGACTVNAQCSQGVCAGGADINCNDGKPCTKDFCDPNVGCVHEPAPGDCDDGDICTANDECVDGVCEGQADLDCNDGNVCTDDLCDPEVGCVHQANQAVCDDGNKCTDGDACSNAACGFAMILSCDDGQICTTDSCDPATGCAYQLNEALCDDNNLCTTGDHCHLGQCISSGQLPCDDSNPCTDDQCNPQTGCAFVPNADQCDDQNQCTLGDQCANGWCMPGPAMECDDASLCTTDVCTPEDGCTFTNNQVPCNDENMCTVNDACEGGECQGGDPLVCDDGNVCTDDDCDTGTGCIATPNEAMCEDGNACTTEDLCVNGSCTPGLGVLQCSDENPCTDDGCNPDIGCIFVNNADSCSDEDACTDDDVCTDGTCVPGPQKVCPDDGNTCTTNTCDSNSGCVLTKQDNCCGNGVKEGGEECDDGNQVSGDGCSDQCVSDLGGCFGDWLVGTPCNGIDHGGGCTPQETGYHWKGIYNGYACWWNTKNQAWNSPATNPWHVAEFFGLDVNTGQVSWCSPFSSTPSPPLGGCHSYCSPSDNDMWGWCGGAPFSSGGWLCFKSGGKQPCN